MKRILIYKTRTGKVLPKQLQLFWQYALILVASFALTEFNAVANTTDGNGIPCTQPCQLRTQTQGGWGQDQTNGENPGTYLADHFTTVFPNGVSIGDVNNICNGEVETFNSVAEVTDFLPAGGTPATLEDDVSNVLAGQALTLTISIGFDAADESFSDADTDLGDAIIALGDFAGWTVSEVLAEANKALGGCGSIYDLSDLNAVLTSINESNVDGTQSTGFLVCPLPPIVVTVYDETACEGEDVVFEASPNNTTLYSYQWYKDDVLIPGATNPTYAVNDVTIAMDGDEYKVRVTDKITHCYGEDAGTLHVNENPDVVVDDEGACEGEDVTFTASPDDAGIYTYQWYKNDVLIPGAISSSYTVEDITLAMDGDVYKVIVTNKTTYCHGYDSGTLDVYAKPTLTCYARDVTTYGGSDGSITVTITNFVAGNTYTYSVNGVNSGVTVTTNQFTVSNLEDGSYTIVVKSSNYCYGEVTCHVDTKPCEGFRTQTMGGWGAEPTKKGNNQGNYLHTNFGIAFPSGITVGDVDAIDDCEGYTLTLTSAQAVTNFLPSGSTARALDKDYTNPTEKGSTAYSNVFAGQVVALTISVGLDKAIPNYSLSSTHLEDLVIISGDFKGMTVGEVLAEANMALAGCETKHSIAQLNAIVSAINEHYVDGKVTGNILACPSTNGTYSLLDLSTTSSSALEGVQADRISAYPTPFSDKATIEFSISKTENYVVNLYDMKGSLVKQLKAGTAKAGELQLVEVDGAGLGEGLYIARMISDSGAKSVKLLLRRE